MRAARAGSKAGEKEEVRVAIRGFRDGSLKFEERLDIDEERLDELLPNLAREHGRAMAEREMTMIELEFLDEADRTQAFFRIGVDPSGMMAPMEVDLVQFAKRKVN